MERNNKVALQFHGSVIAAQHLIEVSVPLLSLSALPLRVVGAQIIRQPFD